MKWNYVKHVKKCTVLLGNSLSLINGTGLALWDESIQFLRQTIGCLSHEEKNLYICFSFPLAIYPLAIPLPIKSWSRQRKWSIINIGQEIQISDSFGGKLYGIETNELGHGK